MHDAGQDAHTGTVNTLQSTEGQWPTGDPHRSRDTPVGLQPTGDPHQDRDTPE